MIKNIIFDVGNVLVRWDPQAVVARFFPSSRDPVLLTRQLFRSPTWLALNRGEYTEAEIIQIYHQTLGIEVALLNELMQAIKVALQPIPGSFELLASLYKAGLPLYALTDNTKEIMRYLRQTYHFWHQFTGVVVSAEVGCLKPSPAIYQYLLDKYQLNAAETVFIDDHSPNIAAADQMNMATIQFENTSQCIAALRRLNIRF